MAGVGAQQNDHPFQGVLGLVFQRGLAFLRQRRALKEGEMILAGRLSTGATMSASPDSIALRGMPSNLAVAGSCTSTTPALLLDGAHAKGAVGTHAGKDDPDAALLLVVREGPEEETDERQCQRLKRYPFCRPAFRGSCGCFPAERGAVSARHAAFAPV